MIYEILEIKQKIEKKELITNILVLSLDK